MTKMIDIDTTLKIRNALNLGLTLIEPNGVGTITFDSNADEIVKNATWPTNYFIYNSEIMIPNMGDPIKVEVDDDFDEALLTAPVVSQQDIINDLISRIEALETANK